jgi:hypothetical protein
MASPQEIQNLITEYLINDLNFPENGNVVCDGEIPHLLMYSFSTFNRGNILRETVHIHITDHRVSVSIGFDKQVDNGIIIYSESHYQYIQCLLKEDTNLIIDCVKHGFTTLLKFIDESSSVIKNAENQLIHKFDCSESKLGAIHVTYTDNETGKVTYSYLTKDGIRINGDGLV